MNFWFSSDWHQGHTNIMKYSNRPFKTIEEMDKRIIENFNDTLKKGDIFYYLGDFSFDNNIDYYFSLLRQDIQMFFILGNHDKQKSRFLKQKIIKGVYNLKDIKIEGQFITLCHYPMVSFNKSHYGAWQLYGHHHTDTNKTIKGKRLNIGVDLWNYAPISFYQIKNIMDTRENNWDFIIKGENK